METGTASFRTGTDSDKAGCPHSNSPRLPLGTARFATRVFLSFNRWKSLFFDQAAPMLHPRWVVDVQNVDGR